MPPARRAEQGAVYRALTTLAARMSQADRAGWGRGDAALDRGDQRRAGSFHKKDVPDELTCSRLGVLRTEAGSARGVAREPDRSRRRVRRGLALKWSLISGHGQHYVGKPVSGSIRLAVAIAAAAAIVTPVVMGFERRSELS